LLGCALAILITRPHIRDFIFRNFPKEFPLLMAFLILLNLIRTNVQTALSTYLLICMALASTLVVEEGLAYKLLNARLLVWIGTISYSVYVWQELFLVHPAAAIPLGSLSSFPLNIICVFVVSSLSFYFVERPFIALGKNLFGRKQERTDTVANL